MEHYAGIDVSLERSSVCVVDATGRIIREAKVASEPEALVGFLHQLGLPLARVGLEAGPLSEWLHAGLAGAGLEAVLLETRQVKAALSAMIVKTDRKVLDPEALGAGGGQAPGRAAGQGGAGAQAGDRAAPPLGRRERVPLRQGGGGRVIGLG